MDIGVVGCLMLLGFVIGEWCERPPGAVGWRLGPRHIRLELTSERQAGGLQDQWQVISVCYLHRAQSLSESLKPARRLKTRGALTPLKPARGGWAPHGPNGGEGAYEGAYHGKIDGWPLAVLVVRIRGVMCWWQRSAVWRLKAGWGWVERSAPGAEDQNSVPTQISRPNFKPDIRSWNVGWDLQIRTQIKISIL